MSKKAGPFARRVEPGSRLRLASIPTDDDGGLEKKEGVRLAAKLGEQLAELDDLLAAADEDGVLIVLQGRDAAGKDGVIRHLLRQIDATTARVASFRVPTPLEAKHDFLWRVHAQAPGRGELVVFNRSHYEDVLVPRVHGLLPKAAWSKRYDDINAFEKLLTDAGILVLKFFLHLSRQEQEERLLQREKEVEKSWKLAVRDWKERERWDAYTAAYEDALARCSTPWAPWHVVPADRKWFRNLAVTEVVVAALRARRSHWMESLAERGRLAKAELDAYRKASQPRPAKTRARR